MADVDLGVGDVEVKGGEAAEGGREVGARGRVADDEVALEADTVDRSTSRLDDVDGLKDAVRLGTVVLEVVVVVVPGLV